MKEMWDLRIYNPFGSLSTRKIFAHAATLFVALLAYIFFFTPHAYAVDATFNGGNITYEGETFTGPVQKPSGADAIPDGAQVFRSNSQNGDIAKFLYFPQGTDPAQAAEANFVQYDFEPPATYTNASGQQAVALGGDGAAAADPAAPSGQETRCNISGVGWLVCPISNFLASGIDSAYDMVKNFVEVEPLSFSQTGSLYPAWDVMRGFANVAFVIAFLVVIYSQLTNVGLTNYGIKRIIPRLIVAAILVNVSYYICAIAIDLSNVTGTSIQNILMGLREQVFEITEDSPVSNISWGDVATFTLSGGAVGAIGVLSAISATGGSIVAAGFALLPIVAGALLIIFVVLLVLAARQAIITMLVILAPLAFVAYILPGTEKWFKRWLDLFTAMMVFFPFFSLLFGGAQFAGSMIIMNANSLFMVLFGMAVQIAPLVALPLIIKFGSSLISRIAGIIDDPRRGVLDRTRNYSKPRQEKHRNRAISSDLKRRNVFRRAARGMEMSERDNARKNEMYKQRFENYAAKQTATSKTRQRVEVELELAKISTDRWQNETKRAFNEIRAGDTSHLRYLQAQGDGNSRFGDAKERAKDWAKGRENYENFTANTGARASHLDTDIRALDSANKAAEVRQQHNYTQNMIADRNLQLAAGGIDGEVGADRALGVAVSQERAELKNRVEEKNQLFRHLNMDSDTRQALALGIDKAGNKIDYVEVAHDRGTYRFSTSDVYARDAAISNKLKTGSFAEIEQIIRESGKVVQTYDKNGVLSAERQGLVHEFADTIAEDIASLKLQGKAIYFGAQTIDEVSQGEVNGDVGLDKAALRIIHKGKITSDALSSMNADAIGRFQTLIQNGARTKDNAYFKENLAYDHLPVGSDAYNMRKSRHDAYMANVAMLKDNAREVLTKDILRRNADANSLVRLQELIDTDTGA